MRRYVVILGLALASLSGCSEESDEKGLENSPTGPAVSIDCRLEPRQPSTGSTDIRVDCGTSP
jgi:hypothetical protein